MLSIKRAIVTGAATATMLGSLAMPTLAVSDNANQQACFGQARAEYASTKPGGVSQGEHSSERKGNNAEMNAAFREACQAA